MSYCKSSLFFFGLLCLISLFVPSTSVAQDESLPPCCYGDPNLLPIDPTIIIIETDIEIPSGEDEDGGESIAQLLPDSLNLIPEMVFDRSKNSRVSQGIYYLA